MRLHHFPLCPFSRKARLMLAERGQAFELAPERPWEKADAFLELSPAGQTPVLVVAGGPTIADSMAICEWVAERFDGAALIGADPDARAEARRLAAWFDGKFYAEVGAPLLMERMIKRLRRDPPDGQALRRASRAVEAHLEYLEWLLDTRRWLAGAAFGMADLAGAAHLSVADYLSGVDWGGHQAVRTWYSAVKSRPSMRPLLAERMEGVSPPGHYDKLDF